jgi:hypothetical protein
VLSNLQGVLSDLLEHAERLLQAEKTPTPALPLSGQCCPGNLKHNRTPSG